MNANHQAIHLLLIRDRNCGDEDLSVRLADMGYRVSAVTGQVESIEDISRDLGPDMAVMRPAPNQNEQDRTTFARAIFDRLGVPTLFLLDGSATLSHSLDSDAPMACIREPFRDDALADAIGSLLNLVAWARNQRQTSDVRPETTVGLPEDAERFRVIFDAFPDGVILADPDTGLIRDVNYQGQKLLGRARNELIGLHQTLLHPEWLRKTARDNFARHLDEIRHLPFGSGIDSHVLRPNGEEIPVEITPCLINIRGKNVILGIFRDVSASAKARAALQESEERYRLLVENLNHVVFRLDAEGRFTYISPVLERITGVKPNEVIGRPFEEYVHPDDVPILYESIEAQLRGETPRAEYRAKRKDGSYLWAAASSRPVFEDGQLVGFTGVWIDVTDRKEAVEALHISEERYRHLFDNAPTGIYEIDFDKNRIIMVNDLAAEYMGMSREQLMSMPATDLLDEEGQKLFGERMVRRAAGLPVSNTMEYFVKGRKGREYWAQFSIKDIEVDGRVKGAQVVAHDITELKKTNQALRASEEKFRSLVNALREGIIQHDAGGAVTFCNQAALDILGLSRDQIMGIADLDPAWRCIREDGSEFPLKHQPSAVSLRTGEAQSKVTLGIQKPDGLLTWISVNTQPIFLDRNESAGVVVSFVDVTANKNSETAIKKALKEKEILLREIHHRVKNNMQVITSLLNLQAGQVEDPQVLEALLESQSRVAAMALVHEALYESESLAEIDLEKYLGGLVRMLIISHTGSRRAPEVQLDIASGIMVGLDQAIPCGLILNELISNSLKHAFPDGQVGVINIRVAEGEGYLTFVVEDDGVGMPADTVWKNTGSLGMTLVTSLTEVQLDGEIRMEQVNGTRFTVRFPTGREPRPSPRRF